MKNVLVMTLFMLATLAWVSAQQPGSAPQQNSGQTSKAPITEGCLGGSAPNYTITDNTGTTYKLNLAPNTDASKAGVTRGRIGAGPGGCQGRRLSPGFSNRSDYS